MNNFAELDFQGSTLVFKLYEEGKLIRHTLFCDVDTKRVQHKLCIILNNSGVDIDASTLQRNVSKGGCYYVDYYR